MSKTELCNSGGYETDFFSLREIKSVSKAFGMCVRVRVRACKTEVINMGNQYKSDYDLIGVLSKLLTVIDPDSSVESIPFKYDTFKQIMMMNQSIKPVISAERTLRQWYNNLIVCEFVAGGRALSRFFVQKAYAYLESEGVYL